jgi:hypothetical protein
VPRDHHSASPKENSRDNKSTKRHVYVEPGVQIDLVKSFKEQYDTGRRETTRQNNEQLLWAKITALLVLVYAGLTLWMAVSTHNMATTAQTQLIDSERAYVSFVGLSDSVKVVSPTGAVFGELIPLKWENSGTTPVPYGSLQIGHGFYPKGLPKDFDFPFDLPPKPFIIGPKQTSYNDYMMAVDDLAAINSHSSEFSAGFFLWGSLAYRDILSGTPVRLTEFCIEIMNLMHEGAKAPDVNDPNVTTRFKFQGCDAHTCYDERCPDYKKFQK